jgi:hypothetical protein
MECDDYSLREGAPGADFTIEELAAWKMKEKSFFEEPEDIYFLCWLKNRTFSLCWDSCNFRLDILSKRIHSLRNYRQQLR